MLPLLGLLGHDLGALRVVVALRLGQGLPRLAEQHAYGSVTNGVSNEYE